jgi:hypothetical protein
MVTTEVTSQSWFGRIGESIKSFLFGLALFVAAFPVLFMNEGRAVKTEKSLKEGAGAVVSVDSNRVDPANEQKLVHMSGQAKTAETLSDSDFQISANAIKLRRRAEMYQWEEKKESKTQKKVGGGSETVTTYSYNKTWSDRLIDSSSFKESGHTNPSAMPYESREQSAQNVTLGAFSLTPSLVGKMNDFQPLPLTDQDRQKLPSELRSKLKVSNGAFYLGADPASAQIGDARISFSVVQPGDVSVISKQTGKTFEPYHASAGMDIEMLKGGIQGAQAMFQQALKENTIFTWILRAVGWFMMFLGLVLFFRPISVLGDVIPAVGSLLAFGTGLFAFVISAVLSIGTVAVAWIAYRPVLGIALLAVAIALLVGLAMRGRKRIAAGAVARPATT